MGEHFGTFRFVRYFDGLRDIRIVDILRFDHIVDLHVQAKVPECRTAVQGVGISGRTRTFPSGVGMAFDQYACDGAEAVIYRIGLDSFGIARLLLLIQ